MKFFATIATGSSLVIGLSAHVAILIANTCFPVISMAQEVEVKSATLIATSLIYSAPGPMYKHESLAQAQLILETAKLAWDMFKEFRTKSDVPKQYANMPAPQLQSLSNPGFIPEWFPVPPSQVKLTSEWFPVAPGMNAATNDAGGWSYFDAYTGAPYGFSALHASTGQLRFFYPNGLRFR